jgi:hypothetical protein
VPFIVVLYVIFIVHKPVCSSSSATLGVGFAAGTGSKHSVAPFLTLKVRFSENEPCAEVQLILPVIPSPDSVMVG